MEHNINQMQLNKLHEAIREHGYFDVSTGTLRIQDLLASFCNIASIIYGTTDPAILESMTLLVNRTSGFDALDAGHLQPSQEAMLIEQAEYCLETLSNMLNYAAPDGYYFGAHAGDGSSFGFYEADIFWE